MSIKLRFLTLAVLIPVFCFPAKLLYAQQLDLTFGESFPQMGTGWVYFGLAVSNNQIHGFKAFRRSDNRIVFLVHNTGIRKSSPLNAMTVAIVGENGADFTSPNRSGLNNAVAEDGALQPDGKTVAVGGMNGDIFVERFDTDGFLDNTFDADGHITLGFGNNLDKATNVTVQSDGKILISGSSSNAGSNLTVVLRLNPDGSPDPTFGPYGTGLLDLYDDAVLSRKMALRPDGKILLAGNYLNGPETVSMFYLLNPNGSTDNTFGDGGLAFAFDTGQAFITDMRIQPDGKAVTVATRSSVPTGTTGFSEQDMLLRRLNQNGSIDHGFGNNGVALANTSPPAYNFPSNFEPSGREEVKGLVIESTGNISVLLSSAQVVPTFVNTHPFFAGQLNRKHAVYILRYDPSGRLIGKNISRRTTHAELTSSYVPFELKGIFQQDGKGLVVYGSMIQGYYFGYSALLFEQGFLARFSSISGKNDANNYFDYNFDGQAEFVNYQPLTNTGFSKWELGRSHTRREGSYEQASFDFGLVGDVPVPGDYNGDGVQDLAVFRDAAGDWFTQSIYVNNCSPMACAEQVHFGLTGDIPAPGDFDGDGKTDRAVFRPSEGNWYILFSTGGYTGLHFGQNGDQPVTGDYDSDGKSDVAVIRRENGLITWYVLQSSNDQFVGLQFGLAADKAVPADYNGDGRTEVAVWRPSDGNWYLLSNYADFSAVRWGADGDLPTPADYDGDRKTDTAVFRPSEGTYYALRSHDLTLLAYHYPGPATDIPVASVYIR